MPRYVIEGMDKQWRPAKFVVDAGSVAEASQRADELCGAVNAVRELQPGEAVHGAKTGSLPVSATRQTTRSSGSSEMRKRRIIEFIPTLVLALSVLFYFRAVLDTWSGDIEFDSDEALRINGPTSALLVCAAWTLLSVFLRPLTTPRISLQRRYALCAFIVGAGFSWGLFFWQALEEHGDPIGKLGALITVGLIAIAVFIRLGWSEGSAPPSDP